jgi:thiol-disulfide isomerase/thioredoxin
MACVCTLSIPGVALAQSGEPKKDAPKSIPAISMGGMRPAKSAPKSPVTIQGDGNASADLTLDLMKYDFEGTKANNRMYMPSSAKLESERPEGITKEPQYSGKPKYAQISIGNGTPHLFSIAIDEVEGNDAKIYLDLNGDGDLTNDGTGDWPTKHAAHDDAAPYYQGTFTFKPGYKTEDGGRRVGQYALNFYWQSGRGSLNYYNASARTGKITIDGKDYDVTLIENDADGLYNKLFDPKKPIVEGEPMTKPVWLLLDGDQFDIRGTFPFGDLNYLATVSDDGSHLTMTPTMKVVRVPRMTERPKLLPVGTMAPDFEVVVWKPGSEDIDTTSRLKLSDFRGKKIVVIDFWATWCGPCMKGIPHLSKVAEAVKGQDVAVVAINTSDDEKSFVRFAKGKGEHYKFTLARDPAGRDQNGNTIARKLYQVTGIPATFVIGKDGKIAAVVSGYTEGDTKLEQTLEGLGVKMN